MIFTDGDIITKFKIDRTIKAGAPYHVTEEGYRMRHRTKHEVDIGIQQPRDGCGLGSFANSRMNDALEDEVFPGQDFCINNCVIKYDRRYECYLLVCCVPIISIGTELLALYNW